MVKSHEKCPRNGIGALFTWWTLHDIRESKAPTVILKVVKPSTKSKDPSIACSTSSTSIQSYFTSPLTPTNPSGDNTSKSTASTISMSAQNARAVVNFVQCEKPRVIYTKTKLEYRQRLFLAKQISNFEYSCGFYLFPPSENQKVANLMIIRPNLQCSMQIEVPYYSSDVGRKDVCSHCGGLVNTRKLENVHFISVLHDDFLKKISFFSYLVFYLLSSLTKSIMVFV